MVLLGHSMSKQMQTCHHKYLLQAHILAQCITVNSYDIYILIWELMVFRSIWEAELETELHSEVTWIDIMISQIISNSTVCLSVGNPPVTYSPHKGPVFSNVENIAMSGRDHGMLLLASTGPESTWCR